MMDHDSLRSLRDRDRDRPLKMELVQWNAISVVRYANSAPRATMAQIDRDSRRVKFSQLPEPACTGSVAPWHLEALLQAAQEAVLAWGAEDTLF
jgi:hypothetical protein